MDEEDLAAVDELAEAAGNALARFIRAKVKLAKAIAELVGEVSNKDETQWNVLKVKVDAADRERNEARRILNDLLTRFELGSL